MPTPARPLEIASWAELLSLAALLINLATAHLSAITSLGGPVHGCAYLFVMIMSLRRPDLGPGARLLGLIPGIGGLLVLRRISSPG